ERPLGTAGCVRYAAAQFPLNDDFLVISGDALTTLDISAAFRFHKAHAAAVTLVTVPVDDPREYGLVSIDKTSRITGFQEKPGWAQVTTDLANTGIYIVSPRALSHIPDGSFDFAKDLFPLLLSQGESLYAYQSSDYWCDIGDLPTYIACQRDVLSGKVFDFAPPQPVRSNYTLYPPVYIGNNVQIGADAQIGPFAVLDDGCYVGAGAKVRGAVLLENTYVGDRAALTGAVLCRGASVKRGAALFEGSVVGAGALVGEYASVDAGVKIWPGKQIEEYGALHEHVREGHNGASLLRDRGFCGEVGVEMTPAFCARLGAGVATAFGGEKIAVGCSGDSGADMLHLAVLSGVLATGAPAWDFGACLETQFDYLLGFSRVQTGIYIAGSQTGGSQTGGSQTAGGQACVRIVSAAGLPLSHADERRVGAALSAGSFARAGGGSIQRATDLSGLRHLYRQALIEMAPKGLHGSMGVCGSDSEAVHTLKTVLDALGCADSSSCRFHLGDSGRRLSIVCDGSGYIEPEKTLALACVLALMDGQDLALPGDAPAALDVLAKAYGKQVHRLCEGDNKARELAAVQRWVRDGLMRAVFILNGLQKQSLTLAQALRRVPAFAVSFKNIPCHGNPGKILRLLGEVGRAQEADRPQAVGEGTRLVFEEGSVLVRPTKEGKRLLLFAEATEPEMAAELRADAERQVRRLSLEHD
ncbi:MAG: sugar phosphate nucleotidyltransferase, partial [Oscillospiraceae bacterium]|nr:sugar phosphate nucleotidyltransferase [Oscillospiraceae bacterium]